MQKNSIQIGTHSDKVMYDKFDEDFLKSCYLVDIVPHGQFDILNSTESITSHQLQELFAHMGFISRDFSELDH